MTPAEMEADLVFPLVNKDGADKSITFDIPAKIDHRTRSVDLAGTSDSGLAVYYYVREGPAFISGNSLHFTPIPPRARFPGQSPRCRLAMGPLGRCPGIQIRHAGRAHDAHHQVMDSRRTQSVDSTRCCGFADDETEPSMIVGPAGSGQRGSRRDPPDSKNPGCFPTRVENGAGWPTPGTISIAGE